MCFEEKEKQKQKTKQNFENWDGVGRQDKGTETGTWECTWHALESKKMSLVLSVIEFQSTNKQTNKQN